MSHVEKKSLYTIYIFITIYYLLLLLKN